HDTANHRFIIEWDSVHYYDPRQQWDKFEVILYDSTVSNGDCEFEFQYLTSNYNTSCTVGEQDFTFSRWIQLVYNGSYHRGAAPLTAGKAILFTPDGPQVGVSEYEFTGSRIPTRLAIGVAPNPLTKVGSIRWQMPVKAMIQLTVYDATGRAIRTLAKGEVAPGHYQAVWDGTDDNGKEIANGVYVFRLDTDAGTVTTKAVLLR
ncbi:MAG: FlgD immunoglobulin-like domain containing protein, partial [bacterium]